MMTSAKKVFTEQMWECDLKFPVLTGLLAVFIFFFQGSEWSGEGTFNNIDIYIMSIVLFFVILSVAAVVISLIERKYPVGFFAKIDKIIAILIIVLGGGETARRLFS